MNTVANAGSEATLHALTEADFDDLTRLARTIWQEHYVPIIGAAQVEYMLGTRFNADYLRTYIDSMDRWLDILDLHGTPVGYCSYALTEVPGEMKLEQLYLRSSLHGKGLGTMMMRHILARAAALGRTVVMLQVNKNNEGAIAVYRRWGFRIRHAVIVDIGQGFVMDDYIMEKNCESVRLAM